MEDTVDIMTLSELKQRIDSVLEMSHNREFNVCIPNNKGGMGGTSVTYITGANGGIDWDMGKFFLHPSVKMIERPPDFTETQFQQALQRIKTLESTLSRLVDAIEGDPKHLSHTVRFAKTALETFKKKPIKAK